MRLVTHLAVRLTKYCSENSATYQVRAGNFSAWHIRAETGHYGISENLSGVSACSIGTPDWGQTESIRCDEVRRRTSYSFFRIPSKHRRAKKRRHIIREGLFFSSTNSLDRTNDAAQSKVCCTQVRACSVRFVACKSEGVFPTDMWTRQNEQRKDKKKKEVLPVGLTLFASSEVRHAASARRAADSSSRVRTIYSKSPFSAE